MPTTDVITTSGLPDSLRVIYSSELEFTTHTNLIYNQMVENKDEFSAQRGQQVTWTIYRQLPPSLAALTETNDINGGKMADFQVSFTVDEYGYAIGTSEKLDLLSYHGPISNIVKSLLAPQMALTQELQARNTFFSANSPYRYFATSSTVPTPTGRGSLDNTTVMTSDTAKNSGMHLGVRRIPLFGSNYIGVCHPVVVSDLRSDPRWIDAQHYAGSTNIFNGEEGMIHGVRYIKSDLARLENAGNKRVQTTLNSNTGAGVSTISVVSNTGLRPGDEITLHGAYQTVNAGYASGVGGQQINYVYNATVKGFAAPNGTDPTQESVVVDSISGSNVVNLRSKLLLDHSAGDFVTDGVDIYPVIFTGDLPAVGKGMVLPPEVRVSLPVDKLRRLNYIGWYGLYGYGVIRNWAYDIVECGSAADSSAPVFPW